MTIRRISERCDRRFEMSAQLLNFSICVSAPDTYRPIDATRHDVCTIRRICNSAYSAVTTSQRLALLSSSPRIPDPDGSIRRTRRKELLVRRLIYTVYLISVSCKCVEDQLA